MGRMGVRYLRTGNILATGRGRRASMSRLGYLILLLLASLAAVQTAEARKPGHAVYGGYIAVEPLTVPVIRQSGLGGLLTVEFWLEPGGEEAMRRAEQRLPRLRDAYIRCLHHYAGLRLDPRRPVDVVALKHLLQAATEEVLGAGETEILLKGAALRARR